MPDTFEGTVVKTVFKNEQNGYAVLDIMTGEGLLVTAVGGMGNVEEGEEVCVTGDFVTDPRFGEQLRVERCTRRLPGTAEGMELFLASGAIDGISKSAAHHIVECFGTDTLRVLEHSPERLHEVKSLKEDTIDKITRSASEVFHARRALDYFQSYGIDAGYASAAYRAWGEDFQNKVEANPYLLCRDNIGLSFARTDAFARDLNIPGDAACRVGAGILQLLHHNLNDGHSCLPLDRVARSIQNSFEIGEASFYAAYQSLLAEGEIVEYVKNEREFVYLRDYYDAECYITDRMEILQGGAGRGGDFEETIEMAERHAGIAFAERQKDAIRAALSRGVLILTGGPGTGKTTTLNGIINCFQRQGERVLIAAPTGRAAKRAAQLTGCEAKTIHRLLEAKFNDITRRVEFLRDERAPLPCSVMIVDEMSMVDVLLFSKLLHALRLGCKLILVGDCDQLPAVGAGNVLKSLIDSECCPVVTLTEVFRQAQQSCIVTSAHQIIRGEMPDLRRKDNDFFFFHRKDPDEAAALLSDLVCRRLPAAPAWRLSPTRDIQVICPSRRGVTGTEALNKILQERLNPPAADKAQIQNGNHLFRTGDKIMQIKNNYNITWVNAEGQGGTGIFNGDIGFILSINRRRQQVQLDFDGKRTIYPFSMLEQIELAYAITVHKSQGCEYEAVVMPLLGHYEKLSYRNLLYTAVTRAKRLLIIIGTPEKVREMVRNNRRQNRYSCLKDMLLATKNAPDEAPSNEAAMAWMDE